MAFMQKQIYYDGYFSIETNMGTEIVPADLIGRTCGTDISAFLGYLEGTPFDMDETVEYREGWLGRMSAPGYLDCTSWSVWNTREEAERGLDEMYGEDTEDSE